MGGREGIILLILILGLAECDKAGTDVTIEAMVLEERVLLAPLGVVLHAPDAQTAGKRGVDGHFNGTPESVSSMPHTSNIVYANPNVDGHKITYLYPTVNGCRTIF